MKDKECNSDEKDRKIRPRLRGNDFLGLLSDNQLPAMNFKESKKGYKLEFAVPGLTKEDFTIQIDGNALTVSCVDSNGVCDKDDSEITLRQGFVNSSFTRSFTLPKDADGEKVVARMNNGMLTVKICKKEEVPEPTRFIPIE